MHPKEAPMLRRSIAGFATITAVLVVSGMVAISRSASSSVGLESEADEFGYPVLRKDAALEEAEEGEPLGAFARVVRGDESAYRAASSATGEAPSATPEIRLGFKGGDDWEPSIAADDFGHVYAFWNHYGDDPACTVCASPHMELQISSDGGRTWSRPRPLLPRASVRQDDPQIVVDPVDGRTVYVSYMLGDKASMYVGKSTDFGKTWRTMLIEPLERGTDKEILAVRGDDVYVAYNAVMKIYVSASHDGGETWRTYQIDGTTNSELGWALPSGGAVDSDGVVYFSWGGYEANGKPSGEVNLFVSKSTDGGRTWRNIVVEVSQAPPQCGSTCGWAYWGPQMALDVDAKDRVYVLYNANSVKFGATRMYFARSTDKGRTWGLRQDVSASPIGANNLFPAIVAQGDGDVRIAWQDDRNGFDDGNDDRSARWNTYYRSSTDGGRSFSREVRLSHYVAGYGYKKSEPRQGYLQPYGDYFELDIDERGRTQAIWGEAPSYFGPGNVWYSRISAS
jgi:hypothetical protein